MKKIYTMPDVEIVFVFPEEDILAIDNSANLDMNSMDVFDANEWWKTTP